MVSAAAAGAVLPLYVPGQPHRPDPVADILVGSCLQAQQQLGVFNNCIMAHIALQRACEALGLEARVQFGHLASSIDSVQEHVPHVWLVFTGVAGEPMILDATFVPQVPLDQLYAMKATMRYVPGPATNPMKGLPLDQSRVEHFVSHPDEYIDMCKRSAEGSPLWVAFHMMVGLVEALTPLRADIQEILERERSLQQQRGSGSSSREDP